MRTYRVESPRPLSATTAMAATTNPCRKPPPARPAAARCALPSARSARASSGTALVRFAHEDFARSGPVPASPGPGRVISRLRREMDSWPAPPASRAAPFSPTLLPDSPCVCVWWFQRSASVPTPPRARAVVFRHARFARGLHRRGASALPVLGTRRPSSRSLAGPRVANPSRVSPRNPGKGRATALMPQPNPGGLEG